MRVISTFFIIVSAVSGFSAHAASDNNHGTYSVTGAIYDATCAVDAAQLTP